MNKKATRNKFNSYLFLKFDHCSSHSIDLYPKFTELYREAMIPLYNKAKHQKLHVSTHFFQKKIIKTQFSDLKIEINDTKSNKEVIS